MKIRRSRLVVNELSVEVWRKPIKRIRLVVNPPDGQVRISVPPFVSDDEVRRMVIKHWEWVQRQRERVRSQRENGQLAVRSGEKIWYRGRLYRLEVCERNAPPRGWLSDDGTLTLTVRPGSTRSERCAALERWYRRQLQEQIPPLLDVWQARMGVQVAEWRIRRMKTRWGTCNTVARRIWLNLELAKKPPACLEYVLVHEMVHLLERRHTARFHALMDEFLPDWRARKVLLESKPE